MQADKLHSSRRNKRSKTHAAGQIRVKTNNVIAFKSSTSPSEKVNALVKAIPVSSEMYNVAPKKRTAMMLVGMSAAGVPSLVLI